MSSGHHEQSYPNSCVPACMCMIQIWRGEPPTEDAFHQGANPGGHPIGLVRKLPRIKDLPASPRGDDADIHLALRQGRRVVVTVCGPRYVEWQQRHYPSAVSKHGTLCPPGSFGAPFHAVLLIARLDDGYELYDPWFPADGQPFRISEDAFQWCFAGHAVVALP
jgi:hypothetical protein